MKIAGTNKAGIPRNIIFGLEQRIRIHQQVVVNTRIIGKTRQIGDVRCENIILNQITRARCLLHPLIESHNRVVLYKRISASAHEHANANTRGFTANHIVFNDRTAGAH